MPSQPQCILTVNGGSSSVKFALFAGDHSPRRLLSGKLERIGLPQSRLTVRGAHAADNFTRKISAPNPAAAVRVLLNWLPTRLGAVKLAAVGHRFVHGGPRYHEPQRITPKLLRDLRRLAAFDPEHLPGEIHLAEAFHRHFPRLPQVACFDTAFHHDLPRLACVLPLPRRYEAQGVRRYGFHGLSYEYLLGELARVAGKKAALGRIIFAHLGNGASLAAVHQGRPVDTSMGLTPAGGVPMGTRTGDLDPGIVWYLARTEKMTPRQFNHLVNFESGLLGLSGTTSDMRDLVHAAPKDPRAAEAIALFCYQIKKYIGACAAALGGLDTLVFAGGIGENLPQIRAQICDNLAYCGIKLAAAKNRANNAVVSTAASPVAVRVIPTDEERIIAQKTREILGRSN